MKKNGSLKKAVKSTSSRQKRANKKANEDREKTIFHVSLSRPFFRAFFSVLT